MVGTVTVLVLELNLKLTPLRTELAAASTAVYSVVLRIALQVATCHGRCHLPVIGTRPMIWPQPHKRTLSVRRHHTPFPVTPLSHTCRQRSTWQACGQSTTTQPTAVGLWPAARQL